MVSPTFDVDERSRVAAGRAPTTDGECLRYRLDVVAASAADVVQSAGGWLYDRAMAGWQVTVSLTDRCDTRPLRILGVQSSGPPAQLAPVGTGSPRQALAVSAEAFAADGRVRDRVLESLDNRLTEVALWGQGHQGWPLRVNRAMAEARYVLSAAARMFKGYALAAAEIPCAAVGPTEMMLWDACSRRGSELVRLDR